MRLWESRTPPGFILGAADRKIRGPPFFCPGAAGTPPVLRARTVCASLLHDPLLRARTPVLPSRHAPFHQKRTIDVTAFLEKVRCARRLLSPPRMLRVAACVPGGQEPLRL